MSLKDILAKIKAAFTKVSTLDAIEGFLPTLKRLAKQTPNIVDDFFLYELGVLIAKYRRAQDEPASLEALVASMPEHMLAKVRESVC